MFKKSILFALFTIISVGSYAQSQFGIRASVGQIMADEASNIVSTDGVRISHDLRFVDFSSTRTIGFFANKRFGFLFAQGEIAYSTFQSNFEVRSFIDDNNPTLPASETHNNVDLSVIGGVAYKNWKIGVGPVFHKSIDFSSDLYQYEFYSENLRNVNAGFQASVGYSLGPVTIDLRYEDLFSNVGDHITLGNARSKFGSDMNSISLGLGVGF
jgi:hypothetical protein